MDVAKEAVESLQTEFKNGAQVRRAHIPLLEHAGPGTRRDGHVNAWLFPPESSVLRCEYLQICRAVATGFVIMGGIGYVVKLVHIPINNILVGGS